MRWPFAPPLFTISVRGKFRAPDNMSNTIVDTRGEKSSVDLELSSEITNRNGDVIIVGDRMPESLRGIDQDELERLNKKLVRKIDLIILPIISILYILNYIDRQNLSAAKLKGIMEDLNMSTQQFATAISILFVGVSGQNE
jgi:hypothetical protein